MREKILDVFIDFIDLEVAEENFFYFLNQKKNEKALIFTVNPEFLVLSYWDKEFKKILNKGNLNLPDGIGLVCAKYFKKAYKAKFLSKVINLLRFYIFFLKNAKKFSKERLSGIDFVINLCHDLRLKSYKIFLLGGAKGVAKKTKKVLEDKFELKISGYLDGFQIVNPRIINKKFIKAINNSGADILFVALGQAKQEKWIYYNLKYLKNIKVAMGLGGSFDYLSGRTKRAPQFLRNRGLEWLWRLIMEPWRLKRIYNAAIVFPYLFCNFCNSRTNNL